MFKKLLPLIVVLALLVAYAGYRAASAQAIGAGNSQNDHSLRNVDPGALSPGFEYWQMQVARKNAVKDHSLRNVDPGALSPGFEYWQMHAGSASAVTSLDSAPDAAPYAPGIGFEYWQMHAGSASEITDDTNLSTGDLQYEQP